jgi:[ribosomal protein S5]-alanine N-acetyltransferase
MQPSLATPRLRLRPFQLEDATAVQRLAGDERVALAATAIPHPYPDGAAEAWISTHQEGFTARHEVTFAVILLGTEKLVGAVSLLGLALVHARGELGYWTGVEFWGNGYCTEAVTRLIKYAQEGLGITRIVARCSAQNQASARVMEKAGLGREGLLPRHVHKRGIYDDVLLYGLNLPGRGG